MEFLYDNTKKKSGHADLARPDPGVKKLIYIEEVVFEF